MVRFADVEVDVVDGGGSADVARPKKSYNAAFNILRRANHNNQQSRPQMDAEVFTLNNLFFSPIMVSLRQHLDASQLGFGHSNCFHTPLFQRRYCWDAAHWGAFWDDACNIVLTATPQCPDLVHSIGRLLFQQGAEKENGDEFIVVDGQQRMTTTLVLLAAIRSLRLASSEESTIRNILFKDAAAAAADVNLQPDKILEYCRFVPTQFDRAAFSSVMLLSEGIPDGKTHPDSPLMRAFEFFQFRLQNRSEQEQGFSLEDFVNTLLNKFTVVVLLLRSNFEKQEAYEAFGRMAVFAQNVFGLLPTREGRLLCSSDLIRNLVLGSFSSEEKQQQVYQQLWIPLEEAAVNYEPEQPLYNPHRQHLSAVALDAFFMSMVEVWRLMSEKEEEEEVEEEDEGGITMTTSPSEEATTTTTLTEEEEYGDEDRGTCTSSATSSDSEDSERNINPMIAYPRFAAAFALRISRLRKKLLLMQKEDEAVERCVQEMLSAAQKQQKTNYRD